MRKLSDEDLRQTVRAWRANGFNKAETARQLGIGEATVFDRIKAAGDRNLIAEETTGTGEKPDSNARAPEVDRLKARCRVLEAALKRIEQDNLSCAEVRRNIMGLTEFTPDPPKWVTETAASRSSPGVPMGHWSDWHTGEVVNPADINFINEFNAKILKRRVRNLVSRTINLLTNHMVNPVYPGFILCLGGDMITGIIHDELKKSNELTDYESMFLAADLITWGIERLVDAFGRVFVVDIDGNHPRATRFVEHKNFRVQNLDWVTYRIVERYFDKDPRVSFFSPTSNEALIQVWDRSFMFMHGHDLGVKGGDGIIGAAGPIIRGEHRVGRKSAAIGRDFDVLCLGHWHQRMIHNGLFVNNTIKGADEYAMKALQAKPTAPSQNLWIEHPQWGTTFHMEVFVDDRPKGAGGEWVKVWGTPQ
jgi:transposase-like protein